MRLMNKMTEHINALTNTVNEVRNTVEDKNYGMDRNDTLVAPLLLPPVNMDIQSQAMETGTQEYDYVIHDFGTFSIYFSKLLRIQLLR